MDDYEDIYKQPSGHEDMLNALRIISKRLSEIEYKFIAKEFTLSEEQMGWLFFCRDLANSICEKYKWTDGEVERALQEEVTFLRSELAREWMEGCGNSLKHEGLAELAVNVFMAMTVWERQGRKSYDIMTECYENAKRGEKVK